jgi:hypothetical protein
LNLENNNTDKDKKKPTEFNRKAFKHAISVIESNGGKYMEAFKGESGSPLSSAAGRYHFLYNSIKKDPLMKGISKRKFMNSTYLQEAVMDKAIDGNLKGYSYGEGKAREIIESSGTDHDVNDVAAMIHFLGAKGTRDYLKNKDNYQVSGEVNKTGNEYVENFRREFDSFAAQPEEENNVLIDRSPDIPQDIPQDTPPQNVAPVQEAGPFIPPEIPTDESIQPAFNYSQERESGKSQEAFIPSDGVDGPATTMNNTLKEGGSLGTFGCGGEGEPPCDDSYFKTIRNSRQGQVRKNEDGSESTHLMADNNKDKAFPTLFRNKDGSWDDFSGDHDAAFKRATKDNEVYSFGNQKDLFKFAREGSWKSNSLEEGGALGTGDASEEVVKFENGGTHEENSLGGIPQGTGANGKPNLVEEGETKWNDYIFSNAIDTSGNFTSPEGSRSNVFEKGGNLKKLKMLASKGGSNNINDYKLS